MKKEQTIARIFSSSLLLTAFGLVFAQPIYAAFYRIAVDSNDVGYGYGYGYTDAMGDLGYGYGLTADIPTVVTGSGTPAATSATLAGTLSSNGNAPVTAQGFDYGTSTSYGSAASSALGGTLSASLTGLTCGVTYHFRATATSGAGTGTGSDATFVTTGCPAAPSLGGGSGSTTGTGATTPVITPPSTDTNTNTNTNGSKPTGPSTTTAPIVAPSAEVMSDSKALTTMLGTTVNVRAETAARASVASSAKTFSVTLSSQDTKIATNFVAYGADPATVKLGSGERDALLRDQLNTFGRLSIKALVQIANGQIPTERNLGKEKAQLPIVLASFIKDWGHRPDFKNAKDNLAWNTPMYRIRFARDLVKERAGIVAFKAIEKGRIPTTPLDWSRVRSLGYIK
ncbi:MAG: hypothetical protein Q7K29_08400 [Thermoleophilia bacterium]|nr:hypothetical protein [Thermoleophilia bacterium]